MKKIKTIVCGTTFGRLYIEAIKQISDKFELVGILANGSKRSKLCAKQNGIALYTSLEQIPQDVSLACVVIRAGVLGGEGTNLSKELLSRGINVIQEQPLHKREIAECMKIAKKNNVHFTVGNLYMNTKSIKAFIKTAKYIASKSKILYVDMAFISQVSYPAVHILEEIISNMKPFKITGVQKQAPYTILTARMGNISLIIRAYNEINPNDVNNYIRFLHKISIGTQAGIITLNDSNGSVIWNSEMYIPAELEESHKNSDEEFNDIKEQIETILFNNNANYYDVLSKQWPEAIGEDLCEFAYEIENNKTNMIKGQKILTVASIWHELTEKIGYALLNENMKHDYIKVEEIIKNL